MAPVKEIWIIPNVKRPLNIHQISMELDDSRPLSRGSYKDEMQKYVLHGPSTPDNKNGKYFLPASKAADELYKALRSLYPSKVKVAAKSRTRDVE